MSPILVRPVREQLEHDRVIRLLQTRLKRRGDVMINVGDVQTTPVKIGQIQLFPDVVVLSSDKAHKLLGTVEVETAESVNHLEAMAQWAHLGRAKAPFHLYIPAGSLDSARRLIAENRVSVAEIWTYHTIGDQTRFTMVHRGPTTAEPVRRSSRDAGPRRPAAAARRPASPASASPARAAKRSTDRKAVTASPRKGSGRPARPSRATKRPAEKTTRAQKRK